MIFLLNEILIMKNMMEAKLDVFKYPFIIFSSIIWVVYLYFGISAAAQQIVRKKLFFQKKCKKFEKKKNLKKKGSKIYKSSGESRTDIGIQFDDLFFDSVFSIFEKDDKI